MVDNNNLGPLAGPIDFRSQLLQTEKNPLIAKLLTVVHDAKISPVFSHSSQHKSISSKYYFYKVFSYDTVLGQGIEPITYAATLIVI